MLLSNVIVFVSCRRNPPSVGSGVLHLPRVVHSFVVAELASDHQWRSQKCELGHDFFSFVFHLFLSPPLLLFPFLFPLFFSFRFFSFCLRFLLSLSLSLEVGPLNFSQVSGGAL